MDSDLGPQMIATVADLGSWRGGSTPSKAIPSNWASGTIPWVTPKDMSSPRIDGAEEWITEQAMAGSGLSTFKPGSIAVVFRSGVLRHTFPVALSNITFTVNQDLKVLEPSPGVVSEFAYHALVGLGPHVLQSAVKSGTTVESVDLGTFLKLSLWLPPEAEQRRIAEVLDAIDDEILRAEAGIAKLMATRRAIMSNLLTCGVDQYGRLRDPEHDRDRFVEVPSIGIVPREWTIAPLAPMGAADRPYLRTGPFGSSLKSVHWVPDGVPVITIGSLGEGRFLRSDLLFVSPATARVLAAYSVQPGDLVFSRVADVGRSVVVSESEAGWIISSNLMRLAFDPTRVLPRFAYLMMVHGAATRRQLRSLVNAGGRDVANTAVLNQLLFAWPLRDEQARIVEIVRQWDESITATEDKLQKLGLIKQGLMRDLLTGRVRVPADG